MTDEFRGIIARYIVPSAMILMIAGFIALCQPWSLWLHEYSVLITLIGLVLFTIFARFASGPDKTDSGDHG